MISHFIAMQQCDYGACVPKRIDGDGLDKSINNWVEPWICAHLCSLVVAFVYAALQKR
jgi:hypothetical protein